MKKLLLIGLIMTITFSAFCQQKEYNILSYGAKADDHTDNAQFIQKAIDEASANGGGQVIIPAGKFITGVIHLKSNVELSFAENAILLGTTQRIAYGPKDASALIVADNQQNIAITGKGIIDGQGELLLKDIYRMLNDGTLEDSEWKTYNPWHQMRPEERNRPKILQFIKCKNIKISGITLKNGLCWIQDYRNSSNIAIDSIKVESNTFWNNDGIDLVDCKNVRLTNSFFNSDDDGICLKSSDRNSRCENIYISNCTVRSSASAIKFGTASVGGFKNIYIGDIHIYDTYRSAIAIECVDGGTLENVAIKNIKAKNTGNAIFIRLGHRNKDSAYSKLRNVYIANVDVEVPKIKPDMGYTMEGPLLDYPHNVFPSSITGITGHPVKNVIIENITISYPGGADKNLACFAWDTLSRVPEKTDNYPEFSMFGELPSWGFYVRHVKGLQMKNIRLNYKNDDFRPACIFDDVDKIILNNIDIPSANEMPIIIFNNVSSLSMKQVQLPVDNNQGILRMKK